MNASAVDDGVVVRTSGGLVSGTRQGEVVAFLGVPYAAPPIGDLRFAAPHAVRWDGVRPANRFGPSAPQPDVPVFATTTPPGDDHLHVNVYTPAPGGTRLPVLVWIHGGAWVTGSNSDPWSQGAALAAEGVVVVSINYRLGVDGFLRVPTAPVPENRGVLDWLAALRWVHDNVAAFGGDPEAVTVGGQSAGSAACLVLATVPAAAGLFSKVVAMSGVPWNLVDRAEAELKARELAAHVETELTCEGLARVPQSRLLEAQQMLAPAGGISALRDPISMFHDMATLRTWLGPVVDGDLLPRNPLEALRDGAGRDLDLLIGSTAEEVDGLVRLVGASLDGDTVVRALGDVGVSDGAAWLAGRTPADALAAALTARCFRAPTLAVADARADGPGSTFVYEVSWRPPTPLGAVHAFDIPFAFGNPDAPGVEMMSGGPPPPSLVHDMSSAVARFVKGEGAGWPRHDDQNAVMRFDVPSRLDHDPELLARSMTFAPC